MIGLLHLDLAHFFVPKSSNNYKARILHIPFITFFLLVIIALQAVIGVVSYQGLGVLGYAANIKPSEIVRLTNEERVKAGAGKLVENPLLTQAAQAKGKDMLEKDYWAHVSPDGVEPWFFFNNVGYKYRYAGENLARDFTNPQGAIQAWLASPSHRDNMLSGKYKEMGVAVVEGDMNGVDTTIIVQLFGTGVGETSDNIVPVAQAEEAEKLTFEPEQTVVEKVVEKKAVVTKTNELLSNKSVISGVDLEGGKISPFSVTKVLSIGIISLFLIVLVIDGVWVARKGIVRISGRTLAHISFLGMVLAIILIAKAGQIF